MKLFSTVSQRVASLRRVASAAALALFVSGAVAAAPVSYLVTVNTSDYTGVDAQIDFQFNPAVVGGVPGATAVVTAFNAPSLLSGAPALEGDAAGDPATALTLGNTTILNASLSQITLSNLFSFIVTFNGAYQTSASLDFTTFSLSLYDAAFAPLGALASGSNLLAFDLLNGAVSFQDLSTPAAQGAPRLLVEQIDTPLPAPGIVVLLMAGAVVGFGVRRTSR